MKLLIITNNVKRASFRQRIGMYVTSLSEAGIDCKVVQYPKGFFARRSLLKSTGRYDAVFLHKRRLNLFDAALLKRNASRIIYDFDDAVMYSDSDPSRCAGKRLRAFARTVRTADQVIAGNRYLADHARSYSGNVAELATGLDTREYDLQIERKDDRVRLVWIGSKSTLKYLAGIRQALEQVAAQCDNLVLRIICDEFLDLENMEVEKLQWSASDQARWLRESDIGLAPLVDDAFTRGKCGFKILQYMAAGIPVIAGPVGVNAELVQDRQSGFHAESTDQWIQSIAWLAENPEQARAMGRKGKDLVAAYDQAVIGGKLAELIHKCAARE